MSHAPLTLREKFCAQQRCSSEKFVQKVFWRTLYPHAVLVAPVMSMLNPAFFEADRNLISAAGDATDMKRIREEVRDFFWDSNNRGWFRRSANIRVSGQRLKELARKYLAEGPSVPPFPAASEVEQA